ncbi:uncharacterized protein [Pithys albifrons albifrons]|uniref:uncharacterized protein n=1 Tax=Pithys albifrons albifrons TaxID=3385563 RepID=UPI003A5CF3EC
MPPWYPSATPLPPVPPAETLPRYPHAAPPAPAPENPTRPQQPWNQSFSIPFVTTKSQEVVFAPPYNSQRMRPPAAAVEAAGPQQQPWNPTRHATENQTVSEFYLNPISEKARWGMPSAERDMWRGRQTPWSFSFPVHPPSAPALPPPPPMPCGYLGAEVTPPPRSPPPCSACARRGSAAARRGRGRLRIRPLQWRISFRATPTTVSVDRLRHGEGRDSSPVERSHRSSP